MCKMQYPLNLVLENLKYLWFYVTFWVVILNGGLKLPKLSNHILTMPFIFYHICYGKSKVKIFSTLIKVKLLVSKASNSCFKSIEFFQMLLASHN